MVLQNGTEKVLHHVNNKIENKISFLITNNYTMKYLIFDVETTGLPKKNKHGKTVYPYVVQLCWLVYNDANRQVENVVDEIIRLPEFITIPMEAEKVHGISNRKMRAEGVDKNIVLDRFTKDLRECDMLIAHNIEFDRTIMFKEYKRIKRFEYKLGRLPMYCTMQMGRNLCKIPKLNKKTGQTYFKNPKLMELHEHLFKTTPKNLHDALVDVWVCWRCFCKMHLNHDIIQDSDKWNYYDNVRKYYKQLCSL